MQAYICLCQLYACIIVQYAAKILELQHDLTAAVAKPSVTFLVMSFC